MRIQPDIIKLDRSLVADVDTDPAKAALIDAFVRFAHGTGAVVCAEGIETPAELRVVADLDVTYGQGYVLARPGPPWAAVDPAAVAVCRSALNAVIRHDKAGEPTATTSELQLERVCHRIGLVTTRAELREVLEPIRALLDVDEVILSLVTADRVWIETVVTNGAEQDDRFLLSDYPATEVVLDTGEAAQVLTSDPDADPAEVRLLTEMGYRSLLMVPLLAGAQSIGVLEACAAEERPWTRSQIHSARILGYQLAHVLDRARLVGG
jgi:hypothetical protein